MVHKPRLNSEEILIAEYNFIANNVFQSNEDRGRVLVFMNWVSSIVTALLGAQFFTGQFDLRPIYLGLFFLSVFVVFLGSISLAQLARLRAAWHESTEAMNIIKEFYIKHNVEIESAFRWRPQTMPPIDKAYSIANLEALQVTVLCGFVSGASIYFLMLSLGMEGWWSWLIMLPCGFAGYFFTNAFYKYLLAAN